MSDSPPTAVSKLFATAKCVLFDFDGPVCDLFAGHPARDVAAELRVWIRGHIPGGVREPEAVHDPLAWLRMAAEQYPRSRHVEALESRLTSHEVTATGSAELTADTDRLIRRLSETGRRLAVTTNNSAEAAGSYLKAVKLAHFFGGDIHGRWPGRPELMKPHPDCLERALETTGSSAAESLMIGDSPADCAAARELGVPFLGYARDDRKMQELRYACPEGTLIVSTMSELVPVLDGVEPGLPVE